MVALGNLDGKKNKTKKQNETKKKSEFSPQNFRHSSLHKTKIKEKSE